MNIKTSTSITNKALLTLSTIAIVGSASLYAMAGSNEDSEPIQDAKHVEKRVIVMEHDGSPHHEIDLDIDAKKYVEKNGERYIEEDGKQRPMTQAEIETFEQHVSQAKNHGKMIKHKKHIASADGKSGHKVIKIIRSEGGAEMSEAELAKIIEDAQMIAEEALHEVEIELMEGELEIASIEQEMERAMHELDNAYKEKEISQKEMKKAQKQIEKARAQLAADRAKMEASIEQARKQTEKLRKELGTESRAH